jgi:hypothetical protein
MTSDHTAVTPGAAKPARKSGRRAPCPRPGSGPANKLAAVVLDVLAGVRLPAQAAQEAGISLPGYYHLEQRVLDAIVRACEPRPRGKTRSPQRQVEQLQQKVQRLEQQCARQQALVRAAHRTIGLAPPPPKPAQKPDSAQRKRSRRPTVRALKAARLLREAAPAQPEQATTAPPVAERITHQEHDHDPSRSQTAGT